jgi:hypothetical protein
VVVGLHEDNRSRDLSLTTLFLEYHRFKQDMTWHPFTKSSRVSSAYSSSGRLARPKEKRRLNIDISSLSDMLGWLFIIPSAHMRVTTSVIPTQVLTFSSGLRLRAKRGSTACIHCIGASLFKEI